MRGRNWLIFVVCLGLSLGGLGYWCVLGRQSVDEGSTRAAGDPASGTRWNKPAETFALKDSRGTLHKLEEYKGSVVVVHFWASWCPPCLEEITQWLETAKKFEGQPVKWVAISLDEKWADAQKVLAEKDLGPNIVSLLDPEKKAAERYGSFQFPETYLLSKQQRLVLKLVGPQDWKSEGMQKVLEKLQTR